MRRHGPVGGPQRQKKERKKERKKELDQLFPKFGPQISRDPRLFPRDPWIHFCNGCFEVYLSCNSVNNVLLNVIAQLL
jgi:hypothetical protein